MDSSEVCEKITCSSFAQTQKLVSQSKKNCWNNLLSSTFPALCSLLARSESEIGSSTNFNGSSSALKELGDIFGVPESQRCDDLRSSCRDLEMDIPFFETEDKFEESPERSPVVSDFTNSEDLSFPKLPRKLDVGNWKDHFAPEFSTAAYHEHAHSNRSGMLQLCCGSSKNIYKVIDNKVREMDRIIKAPMDFLGPRVEQTCMLNLPGPYSCARPVRIVKFQSNRYVLDVLGLFLVLIDTILATKSISCINFDGVSTPLEFTPNISKVVNLLRVAFPNQFSELQKLVMYSTLTSVLKKAPMKWNRCMTYVLEDLLIHPFPLGKEDMLEQALLVTLLQKRAKTLLRIFASEGDSHIFNSASYLQEIQQNFSPIKEFASIEEFMKVSASNCLEGHRIKNIKFEVKDRLLELYQRDLCLSYSNFI